MESPNVSEMMNHIKARFLFFGSVADQMGRREATVELDRELSIQEAFLTLELAKQTSIGRNLLFAVNQEFATGNEILSDSDEIAVFTAVSGG